MTKKPHYTGTHRGMKVECWRAKGYVLVVVRHPNGGRTMEWQVTNQLRGELSAAASVAALRTEWADNSKGRTQKGKSA